MVHLYDAPKSIGSGDRAGAAFSGYHKTKVRNANKEYEDHFTSIRGTVWGKEAEWLLRDGQKGSLVVLSGLAHVEKYEKDGKSGATLKIDCHSARLAERKDDAAKGESWPAKPAAVKAEVAKPLSNDEEPPF